MGKVIAKLRVTNEADLLLKRHGALSRQPRRAEVEAVVDPRVVSFRLQRRIAEALGVGVSRPARLELMGRSCLANVTLVGDDQPNILDRLALMEMDLVLDATKQRLIPNPEHDGKWITEEFAGASTELISRPAAWRSPEAASRSEAMTVAVGFSPRKPGGRGSVVERRLNVGNVRTSGVATRRSHYPLLARGLKSTATIKSRYATSQPRGQSPPPFVIRHS